MRNAEAEYLENISNVEGRGDRCNWGCDIRIHLPLLRFLAKGNVLEIGTRASACSTGALLLGVRENGGHLYSVDLEIESPCSDVFAGDPQWTFIHGDSKANYYEIIDRLPRPIDLLFIDGAHGYDMVLNDLQKYEPLVRPGGVTLLHDTDFWDGNKDYCGVRQAMETYSQGYGGMKPAQFFPGSFGLGIIRN